MKYGICSVDTLLTLLATTTQAQSVLEDESEVAALDTFQECDVCPEMNVLPKGDFMLGGQIRDSIYGLVMLDGKLAMVEVGHPTIGANGCLPNRCEIDILIPTGGTKVTQKKRSASVDNGGFGSQLLRNIFDVKECNIHAK